jgi:diguanylate cyclase (GGDEF)-like protein/putative nucleotidyltransferase with HDIG domain
MRNPSFSFPATEPTPATGRRATDRTTAQWLADGQEAEKTGRRQDARHAYHRALLEATTLEDARQTPTILRWIARTFIGDAQMDDALDWLAASVRVAEAWGDESAAGSAINMQAVVRWQSGDLDEAERLYLRARARAVRAGDARLAAMTAQNLGVIATVRGDHMEARRHYEASLAEYRALGMAKDMSVALNNLGLLHSHQQHWADAEQCFREAVDIVDRLGDVAARTMLDVNLAEMWVMRQQYANARQSVRHAMTLAAQTGDAMALGQASKLLGIIARETGDLAEAEAQFARAAEIAQSRSDVLLQAEVAREAGELARRQGRNGQVLTYLNRAHRLFTQLRARRDLADIDQRTGRLEEEFEQVARRWGESIEAKDRYTQGHCVRVADLACEIASELGMAPQDLFWFRIGALLHDVGKIVIPEAVLNKPGRLDDDEWALMRSHTTAGVDILADVEFPWDVLPVIRSHHERWDGKGYPDQLAGDAIPLVARILCVADVYDALTSVRSYKRALTHEQAVELMGRDVGTMFDPYAYAAFERIAPRWAERSARDAASAVPSPAPSGDVVDAVRALDDLTGLPQRRAFRETGERLLLARQTSQRPVSLLVIDIDHFKLVNDTFGHLQGDAVLRIVADALRGALRVDDYAARYAGDEFAVVLPGTRIAGAMAIAERIRAAVDEARIGDGTESGRDIHVTLSIGVATAPEHGETLDPLFATADGALYAAKRRGRNQVAAAGVNGQDAGPPMLLLDGFVGRQAERERMRRLLEEVANGRPRVLCVTGEAGIGKSTLLQQLAPNVGVRSGVMAVGRCLEADVRPPYGPWADLLSQLPVCASITERPWRELSRLLPSLGASASHLSDPDDLRDARYALLQEIQEFITLAARERPLVVVLDDMQWADDGTWDVLELLVARLREQRLLIALSVRPEDLGTVAAARLSRLSRAESFTDLLLPRLRPDEVALWIRNMLSGQSPDDALVQHVVHATEGNPLYTLQTVRALADDARLVHDGQRWVFRGAEAPIVPTPVRDLLERRLDRLADATRDVLHTAALIGTSFDAVLLLDVAGHAESVVTDALDEAAEAHLLVPEGAATSTRYRFTHTLLAEVLRASGNRLRTRRTHERIARALADRSDSHPAEVAQHFAQAGCGGEGVTYALRAADHAAQLYAYDALEQCLTLAEQLAQRPADQAAVQWRLASLYEATGRLEAAEAVGRCLTTSLAEGAREIGVLRPAERQMQRLRLLRGTPVRDVLPAFEALHAAAVEADDVAEVVALLMKLSHVHALAGDVVLARAQAEAAVEGARQLGDAALVAEAMLRLGTAMLATSPGDAVQQYRQAHDRFTALSDRRGELRCQINIGVASDRAGSVPAAERAYRAALDIGAQIHAADLTALASMNLGVLLMKTGDLDEARRRLTDAHSSAAARRNEPLRLTALYNLAQLALETDDDGGALELFATARQFAQQLQQTDILVGATAGAGLAELRLGNGAAARLLLTEARAGLRQLGEQWFQGREFFDALTLRLQLLDAPRLVPATLDGALRRIEPHDPHAAIWLAAECVDGARRQPAVAASLVDVTRRQAAQARALGYAPLIARLGAPLHLVA